MKNISSAPHGIVAACKLREGERNPHELERIARAHSPEVDYGGAYSRVVRFALARSSSKCRISSMFYCRQMCCVCHCLSLK